LSLTGNLSTFVPAWLIKTGFLKMTDIRDIRIEDYDYPLPDQRIARYPLNERDKCKLLVRSAGGSLSTHVFSELPALLTGRSAMLVYNNTRVINARLRFHKENTGSMPGASIEIFCLEPSAPSDYERSFASMGTCEWICFVGNSKRWKEGALRMRLVVGDHREVELLATRVDRTDNASVVRFEWQPADITFSRIIEAAGEIPIPPYLNRSTEQSDAADYQTVYSHIEGSVAAPTAGLHFTDGLLSALDAAGVRRREVTLHVGAGTFQPVKSDDIGHHLMHSEFFAVERALVEELSDEAGTEIIAVGTTSVRTLESLYHAGCLLAGGLWNGEVPQWYPYGSDHPHLSVREAMQAVLTYLDSHGFDVFVGATRLIIAPGYEYMVVKGMVTNFHQPRSTLLLLVSAMIGGSWREVYDYALAGGYRFLSYGDACLFLTR